MTDRHTQVVIVGGGPVGLGLAIDLAERGVQTVVIEQRTDPAPIPKGQNLTQRTMEHFRAWGIERAARRARVLPGDFPIAGLTAYGNLLSGYVHPWHRRHLVRDYYLVDNERLPQYETERVLRERAATLGNIDLRTGWRAMAVSQGDVAVTVDMQSLASAATRSISADFLVGCDGSHSIVPAAAGIALATKDHEKQMALLLFRSRELHQILEAFPDYCFYNVINPELNGYWRFLGRVDVGESFFFHAPLPSGTTPENFDFQRLLEETVGARFEADIHYAGSWDLRFTVASRYRSGRMFVAGDAAHSHPPYGGYGINTGFEDARNLAWKLAAHFDGWAGNRLLESYSLERQPVFQSTANDFILKYINDDRAFMRQYDPAKDREAFIGAWEQRTTGAEADVQTFEPHYEGSPVVAGPAGSKSSALGEHRFEARAGHHLAPQPCSGGDDVFSALGPGYTLLALDASEQSMRPFIAAAEQHGVPLTIIRDDRVDGRGRYASRLVLVRPDEYVAWCGDGPPDDIDRLFTLISGA